MDFVDRNVWDQMMGGQLVERRYAPGSVIFSFCISYIGSWTTLELIMRRTYLKGWYNWFLLVGASVSMGGVATWCMQLVGNGAIILGDGSLGVQISYSAGYTILSFILPIVVLFIAFTAVGINEDVSFVRLGLGGTLAGLGVCGMHYLGQASITNYECTYDILNVVGAALVAVVASCAALCMFFVFRSSWSSAWWKRALCAIILATAVTGMHWTASVGTAYRWKEGSPLSDGSSKNALTIVVIVLGIGSCYVLLLLILITQAQRMRSAKRARQVVLAAAIFDKDGRILVTAEGGLPNQKITGSYRELSVNDAFDIAHPTFVWIYRTSRNWQGVESLIPPMKEHLHVTGFKNRFGAESDARFFNDQGTPIKDYHLIFRELFCTAAADLAEDLNQPIAEVGVLYEEIIQTGLQPKYKVNNVAPSRANPVDLEREGLELEVLGKGQLLFLIKTVDKQEAEHLRAYGYRFANVQNVIHIVAKTFQLPSKELERHLKNMRQSVIEDHFLDPGVHLAFFAVKAAMGSGFEILCRKDAKNLLPTMSLPLDKLERWQLDYLRNMEDSTATTCLSALRKAATTVATTSKESVFATQLLISLEALRIEIDDFMFNGARLIANPVYAPCRGHNESSRPGQATVIIIRSILSVGAHAPGEKLDFTPLTFFRAQQHVFKNSPDHGVLARNTYREFAPLLHLSGRPSTIEKLEMPKNEKQRRLHGGIARMEAEMEADEDDHFSANATQPEQDSPDSRKPSLKERVFSKRASRTSHRLRGDNSSERNLVDHLSTEEEPVAGIMVSQEVEVDDTAQEDRPASPPHSVKNGLGGMSESMSEAPREGDRLSYVDEVFEICMKSRGKQSGEVVGEFCLMRS